MSLLGNILWLIFGGLLAGLGYILGGLLLCLTIIGIPFGLKAIDFGIQVLAPFGKSVVARPQSEGCLPLVFNGIWIILFGWEIAVIHLLFGTILLVTVVGIPFAAQHFKLMQVALFPFSYQLV